MDSEVPEGANLGRDGASTADGGAFRGNLFARLRGAWRTWRKDPRSLFRREIRERAFTAAEVAVLVGWTLLITSRYLNLDEKLIPTGDEFLGNVQTLHTWNWMRHCGACAFWFGGINGGFPTASEVTGSTFHPITAAATLIWGVVNGSKMALVASFLLAGLAQWWLARVLGVGRVARVWSAGMAVVAGSLASRLVLGAMSLVVSAASFALVLPPLILLSRTGRRREAALLGIAVACLFLGGTGYLQLGFVFLAPATLLLLGREKLSLLPRYIFAAGLAFLLAAPLLVPFLHFFSSFAKDTDPSFRASQPFSYVPLNLVINDWAFYRTTLFGMVPNVSVYALFVGWVPVLLAFWGLKSGRNREERRTAFFLAALALISFWLASAGPQKLLMTALPFGPIIRFLSGPRYTGFMAALAVPPLLGLAALGLDRILTVRWPGLRLTGSESTSRFVNLNLRWLMAIPLVWALLLARKFTAESIGNGVTPFHPEVPTVIAALHTDDLQWVSAPEKMWIEPALEKGMKLTNYKYNTWHWKDRDQPGPMLVATRGWMPVGMTEQATVPTMKIFKAPPGSEYAAVTAADGRRTVCTAHGEGGNIDVLCDTAAPGILVVKENSWTGWKARTAAGVLPLLSGQWISVRLPAGRSAVQFRYRPWDEPLGIILWVCGLALCLREFVLDRRSRAVVS